MIEAQVEKTPSQNTVILKGTLDAKSVGSVESALLDALHETPRMVLDMGDVNYMDSTGLGLLVTLRTESTKKNVQFLLRRAPEHVIQLLQLTRLKDSFSFE